MMEMLEKTAAALEQFNDYIKNETLSETLSAGEAEHECDLNGQSCKVSIGKA